MVKGKTTALPLEGSAFAFPLADGRFSVCRVLLDHHSKQSQELDKTKKILVAVSAWIGDEIPDAKDPALRPILYLNHHSWKNEPGLLWISDSAPDSFVSIGEIEASTDEKALQCRSFGGWQSLILRPLAQWRWDHDRDAVVAEDAIKERKQLEDRQKAELTREDYLREVTLQELLKHEFFSNWADPTPPAAIIASRKLMTATVQKLLELGEFAPESEPMSVLQQCIESFNELDAEFEGFIETGEREDICEEFEAIVHACGLGEHENLADEWREW